MFHTESWAKRTILIFNVEDMIYGNTEKEIETEVMELNNWIEGGIENIFKFPKSKIIKITFKNTANSKKASTYGLLAFNMRIPKHNIEIEDFVIINICYRCIG